ncbi:probable inactive leucine-rich repeat receptor-like protein kinase At3g03770 isoform X2 [Cornus florida]|uniref:probable inactive leucine-rich repeat receptor-like protein kinase At3g03770 isoform X2 n=1 Tax=Cornus florida TaxID=4283 RepID=UPI002898005C|nr:probable inactive leucine-rich repeat receptor-like protein kinase At3g03770 isoform X2 [Cornus florida]
MLRKHLEYPLPLEIWGNQNGDLCSLTSTPNMSIKCQDNSVTKLEIKGDKLSKVSEFNGYPVPNHTLSKNFSIDFFVTTLTRLTTLKVVSLVSLGIWGPFPDKIRRLSSLEFLDMSSNFMFGSIPPQLSRLVKLQTLTLDRNFFNDTLPNWLDSFSNLTILSVKNNKLKGQFPSSISKITTLTDIALSHNKLSGKLPDLSSLTSLRLLDLRGNHLNSELPLMPKGLSTVLLSKNSFSGKIPEQYGKLNQLQYLDLSFNLLSGTLPSALFFLPNITYLNLASNMLSGALSSQLSCGVELGYIDISSNRLIGALPSCLGNTLDGRVVNFSGNCLSNDTQHQHHKSYCKEASRGREIGLLVGVIGGTVIIMVLLALGLLILRKRNRTLEQHTLPMTLQDNFQAGISSELLANARLISQAVKIGTRGAPAYRLFSLEELEKATSNFDQSMFLGEGSIGKLYKGKVENGTQVAVRSLTLFRKYSIRNLKLRLDLLSKLHHLHLVGLLGHCIDDSGQDDSFSGRIFLVYEYMPNGNFRTRLSESCPENVLKWSDRLAVLVSVAKAVHFLHTGVIPASFSNRLKTNNILLDQHGIAKLSDYGLSIITDRIEKLEVKEDDSKSWHISKLEDDVYNFGFILLESIAGPISSGKREAFMLNEMESFGSLEGHLQIVDPIVLATSLQESLSIVISITKKCISPESSTRPSIEDVLWNLQYASQVQATADADQKPDAASQS